MIRFRCSRTTFRLRVVCDKHDEIDVAREPHLRPNGYRETAKQSETTAAQHELAAHVG